MTFGSIDEKTTGSRRVMVSLRLTPLQAKLIKEAADALGISASAFIRRAVGLHLFEVLDDETDEAPLYRDLHDEQGPNR